VFQEVLKAVATSLNKFAGDTTAKFWAWSYRIARNKLGDHYRSQRIERMQPMPPEEILELVEASQKAAPLSPADKHDLEYALNLLTNSKPECREYLWNHFVLGLDYGEIAEAQNLSYDNARMRITRCLDEAKKLVARPCQNKSQTPKQYCESWGNVCVPVLPSSNPRRILRSCAAQCASSMNRSRRQSAERSPRRMPPKSHSGNRRSRSRSVEIG